MTTAVCYKCGAIKLGCWTTCDRCRVSPSSEDELVVSMALSDHFLNSRALLRLSEHVAAGLGVEVDPPMRASVLNTIRSMPPQAVQLGASLGLAGLRLASPLRRRWTFAEQPPCGAVQFDQDGKSIIFGQSAVPPTHALGHILLRTMAEPGYATPAPRCQTFETGPVFATLESWAALQDGIWPAAVEEEFARQFDVYAAQNSALSRASTPTTGVFRPELQAVFQILCPLAPLARARKTPWWRRLW